MNLHDKNLIYHNSLCCQQDVKDFKLEGKASVTFQNNRMRIENTIDDDFSVTPKHKPSDQLYNIVYWCPEDFPSDIAITWDFLPLNEPGLCIMFFAAKGIDGEDALDPSLKVRTGQYNEYHHGEINAYHLSYFRRRYESEQAFQLINLRKSYGFHMVAQGADPIPSLKYCDSPYRMKITKLKGVITAYVNDMQILQWSDDDTTIGAPLQGGKIAFRQMAPMIAEYANLKVYAL